MTPTFLSLKNIAWQVFMTSFLEACIENASNRHMQVRTSICFSNHCLSVGASILALILVLDGMFLRELESDEQEAFGMTL
jgi:hypothetical protein